MTENKEQAELQKKIQEAAQKPPFNVALIPERDGSYTILGDVKCGYIMENVPIDEFYAFGQTTAGLNSPVQVIGPTTPEGQAATQQLILAMQATNRTEFLSRDSRVLRQWFQNWKNFDRFNFDQLKGILKGGPLIFAGAGPSLDVYADQLRKTNVPIIAGGSGMQALKRLDIKPWANLMIDPNPTSEKRYKGLEGWEDVPIIYKGRARATGIEEYPGPKLYVKGIGGYGVHKLEGCGLDLDEGGHGVSTWIFRLARFLGAGSLYLVGVDLAMPSKTKKYCDALPDSEFNEIIDQIIELPDGTVTSNSYLAEKHKIERALRIMQDPKNTNAIEELHLRNDPDGLVKARLPFKVYNLSLKGLDIQYTEKTTELPELANRPIIPLKKLPRKYYRRCIREFKDMIKEATRLLDAPPGKSFDIQAEIWPMKVTQYMLTGHYQQAFQVAQRTKQLDLGPFKANLELIREECNQCLKAYKERNNVKQD